MGAGLVSDGLTIHQLAPLMQEMSVSDFINPVVDELFVRIVISPDCFSSLIVKHPVKATDQETTRYEIHLNVPGILLIANLASVLLGDHRNPEIYADSAFSTTYFSISPRRGVRFIDMFNVLQRESPDSFNRIVDLSHVFGSFAESATSIRRKFYNVFSDHDVLHVHQFAKEAVTRFLLGHEVGHYVRRSYPKIKERIEQDIMAMSGCETEDDPELFCDAVGIFHSIIAQKCLGRKIRPTVILLCLIIVFFDIKALSSTAKSGRKSRSNPRYQIFQGYARKLQIAEMERDIVELTMDTNNVLFPVVGAIDDMLRLLASAASASSSVPDWSLSSKDFIYLRQTPDQ